MDLIDFTNLLLQLYMPWKNILQVILEDVEESIHFLYNIVSVYGRLDRASSVLNLINVLL